MTFKKITYFFVKFLSHSRPGNFSTEESVESKQTDSPPIPVDYGYSDSEEISDEEIPRDSMGNFIPRA